MKASQACTPLCPEPWNPGRSDSASELEQDIDPIEAKAGTCPMWRAAQKNNDSEPQMTSMNGLIMFT